MGFGKSEAQKLPIKMCITLKKSYLLYLTGGFEPSRYAGGSPDINVSHNVPLLYLQSCPHVTVEGWKNLTSLKHLQWLEIDECDVPFDVMTEITKCVSLTRLHLHKNRYLGADSLHHLRSLPDLQRLHLTYNRNLAYGSAFKFCGNLTHLDLRYTNITCKDIATICTEQTHLKVLSLRGCRVITDILRKISQLRMLEELDLNGVGILGDWMEIICSTTSLQKLDLSHSGEHLTSESLLLIDSLSALRALHLGWKKHVNDDNLAIVSHLEFLRTLDVHRCADISDAGLHHISTMKSLREINLDSCVLVTDVGISELAKIECLESVDVGYTSITDVGLFELSKLRVLTVLNITGCESITEEGAAHLASCVYLRKLNISHTGVTDTAISRLQPLIYLKKLNVNSCVNLTNDSLRSIGALLSLENLCIGHNPNFDNFGLEHLKSLRSLRKLKCWHTRIDYQGLKKLAGCTLLKKIRFCKT